MSPIGDVCVSGAENPSASRVYHRGKRLGGQLGDGPLGLVPLSWDRALFSSEMAQGSPGLGPCSDGLHMKTATPIFLPFFFFFSLLALKNVLLLLKV